MNRSDKHNLARNLLFSHLSPSQIREIEQISLFQEYAPGEILFYEGEESRYFHLLLEGEVSVFKSSAADQSIIVHRFRAPSMIAEVATLRQIPYPASAEARRACTLLKIKREPFLELLRGDPSLSLSLIASLTQKIAALESALQRHSAPTAAAKVARLIVDEPSFFSRLKGIEIAELLGITPETLSRTLKKFQSHALISIAKPRGVAVLDREKLSLIADNNFPLR